MRRCWRLVCAAALAVLISAHLCIFIVWLYTAPAPDTADFLGNTALAQLTLHGSSLLITLGLRRLDNALAWQSVQVSNSSGPCAQKRLSSPLFRVVHKGGTFSSLDCRSRGFEHGNTSVIARFACPGSMEVTWRLLMEPSWHFARVFLDLTSSSPAPALMASRAALQIPRLAPRRLVLLELPPQEVDVCGSVERTGLVAGSPVIIDQDLFLGVEHPMGGHELVGRQTLRGEARKGVQAVVDVGGRQWPPRNGTKWHYSLGFGTIGSEASQARRSFLAYLEAIRPPRRWRGPMLHYNSWFDMHSWQDDEFFEGQLLQKLRRDEMNEELALKRVEQFRRELTQKRHVGMDSYLWDDGWDDPKTLWDFNRKRFPRGFTPLRAAAENASSGIGVWLSPWGGYGSAQDDRLALGRKQGFEINAGGFSLAGPRYFARFRSAAVRMRHEFSTNLFKFDGVAGDPDELAEEMEAMLVLITELRAASHSSSAERVAQTPAAAVERPNSGSSSKTTRIKESVASSTIAANKQNSMTKPGAHQSHAASSRIDSSAAKAVGSGAAGSISDSSNSSGSSSSKAASVQVTTATSTVGGSDTKGKKGDKEPDPWINLTTGTWPSPYFLLWADSIWRGGGDVGYLRTKELKDLTRRQQWIVWRELLVCRNVAAKAQMFPLSQLMIHGVVVGMHGEALLRGLHEHTAMDFAQEAWAFVGMGLQLQELYISPQLLKAGDWDNLAEALLWSRKRLDVLRDAHWVLGQFESLEPYGVAAWTTSLGVLLLRNPLPLAQETRLFNLFDVLELPESQTGTRFRVSIVRSLSHGPERAGCALGEEAGSECIVTATNSARVALRPFEVLLVELHPI